MAQTSPRELIAFYGTLKSDSTKQTELSAADGLAYIGRCVIPGKLYDMKEYPGLVEGDGKVQGELFEIREPGVLRALDEYEEYHPLDLKNSLYIRRQVRLLSPSVTAWVYFYNGPVTESIVIPEGDWNNRSVP